MHNTDEDQKFEQFIGELGYQLEQLIADLGYQYASARAQFAKNCPNGNAGLSCFLLKIEGKWENYIANSLPYQEGTIENSLPKDI